MSNIVSQIHTAIDTLVATQLGASYQRMRKMYNPGENDLRNSKSCYAVLHGSASNAEGVTRVYTLNHAFRVQIMTTFVDRLDDSKIQTEINSLYDKIDAILVNMHLTKLGLSSIVLLVNEPSIDEPQILFENTAVLISFGINVRYRNAIA
jgi:hypothetical protein